MFSVIGVLVLFHRSCVYFTVFNVTFPMPISHNNHIIMYMISFLAILIKSCSFGISFTRYFNPN
jgi:hypothetical protein